MFVIRFDSKQKEYNGNMINGEQFCVCVCVLYSEIPSKSIRHDFMLQIIQTKQIAARKKTSPKNIIE